MARTMCQPNSIHEGMERRGSMTSMSSRRGSMSSLWVIFEVPVEDHCDSATDEDLISMLSHSDVSIESVDSSGRAKRRPMRLPSCKRIDATSPLHRSNFDSTAGSLESHIDEISDPSLSADRWSPYIEQRNVSVEDVSDEDIDHLFQEGVTLPFYNNCRKADVRPRCPLRSIAGEKSIEKSVRGTDCAPKYPKRGDSFGESFSSE